MNPPPSPPDPVDRPRTIPVGGNSPPRRTRVRRPTDEELDQYLDVLGREAEIRHRQMKLEAGWLGHVVGLRENAQYNIAFVIIMLSFVAGLVGSFVPELRAEIWKIVAPIFTAALGFVFGRSRSP